MNTLTWQAKEFEQPERHPKWFAVLWIFAAALVIIAVILKSYLLAVFVLVSGGVIHISALKEPREVTFTLTLETLTVGSKIHQLEDFGSFWIFERENGNVLVLESKKKLSVHLHIPLGEISPQEAREILAPAVTEKEQEESLIDLIAEWLRF